MRWPTHPLPPLRGFPELVQVLVRRLKAEWPAQGARRIAGPLARLGVKASRSGVQRILRRPRPPRPDDRLLPAPAGILSARRPNHVWMIDFTRLKGLIRPVFVGAVNDAFSRKMLAVGVIRGAPDARFAVRLLRRVVGRNGSPMWLVSDEDPACRNRLVNALLHRHRIRRRHGTVGKKGSIAIIERMWRSMKQEYVRHLLLYGSASTVERPRNRWRCWHNGHRPHQGLDQQTPDEVYRGRPPPRVRNLTAGTLSVRFLDGDRRLPVLRLRRAA